MKIKLLLFCIYCMVVPSSIFALECPKYPEHYKKDWDAEINLAIGKIGSVKGAELQAKVKNVTMDLIAKFPNAEKIYLEQMMYAAYCSALRDDKAITETEKAKRVKEYNEEIRKAFSALPSESKNDTNIGKKSLRIMNTSKSIRGSVVLEGRNREGLNDFVLSSKIKFFGLSLDDIILKEYYIIILHLKNIGIHIIEPLTFSLYTGSPYSKIIDIQHKINKPKNKTVNIKSSIPAAKWVWPESGFKKYFIFEYPISNEEWAGVNIYRSILRDSGYGRINPTLVDSPESEAIAKATHELFPVYYKISKVNRYGKEYDLSEPVEVGNLAPFRSFVSKDAGLKKIDSSNADSSEYPLDESILRFAKGFVDITFSNGLDASADIQIYILCKILPGSILAPIVTLEGSPSVSFDLRDKKRSIEIPAVHFMADKLRETLTPLVVNFYATSESIYLKWVKPKTKEFKGVRIFRTQERQIGDLQELKQEEEIYYGPGLKEKIVLVLPLIEKVNVIGPTARLRGNLRSNLPPERPKLIPRVDSVDLGKNIHRLGPPTIIGIREDISFSSDYYLDTPPDRQKYQTYVIYGYDGNGNTSYPVFINASTARLGSEITVFK